MVHDLRMLLREIIDRAPKPRAVFVDSRTRQSTLERWGRAGDDGHNRRTGATVHLAVATLGQVLAVVVTPANEHDRAQVAVLVHHMQEVTGDTVAVTFVDQGDPGAQPAAEAAAHGSLPEVVTLPTTTHRVVVLLQRWMGERSFVWMTHCLRLMLDDERIRRRWPGNMSLPLPLCWHIGLSRS